jgi:hypothetical protein
VWIVTTSGNASMVADFQTALGGKLTKVAGSTVGSDVWIQDEFEFATMVNDQTQRMDVTIDSIRDRGLQIYSDTWFTPDSYAQTWGARSRASPIRSARSTTAAPEPRV